MKLKLTVSIACLFMLSPQLIAQRTVTNKGYGGKIIEQYIVNANGDMHGTYKTWNRQGRLIKNYNYQNGELHGNCLLYFDNGTVQEESTYYKGTMTSLKVYQYNENGTKRKLIRNATWDRSGNVLTDGDNAGTLPNGRWRFNYPRYGDYSETYNGNDTLYVWDDRAKQRFLGKQIDGIFMEYKSQLDIELAIRDSVRAEKYLQYEDSRYTNSDSIATLSDNYYRAFMHHFDGNEQELYAFLYTYMQTGQDKVLRQLIIDVLDLSYITDKSALQFHIRKKSNDSAELEVLVGNTYKTILGSCKYHGSQLMLGALEINGYETTNTQSKLLKMFQYTEEHKLPEEQE